MGPEMQSDQGLCLDPGTFFWRGGGGGWGAGPNERTGPDNIIIIIISPQLILKRGVII